MSVRILLFLCATVPAIAACRDSTGESPLVDLANRLYLDGDWTWTDSVSYQGYAVGGEEHHGWYIVTGSASLDELDSLDFEAYALAATAVLFHVDSVGTAEREQWTVEEIEFADTVEIMNDTIFGLAVEPIPPEANPNTNEIVWSFGASQLWCTNWLTDSSTAGNGDDCRTTVRWERGSGGTDSTGAS